MTKIVLFFRSLRPRAWLSMAILLAIGIGATFFLGGLDRDTASPKPPQSQTAPGEAAISADAASASGIAVETAGPATISETITLYGSIKPNAEREQELRARYPGIVRKVTRRPGEIVGKGETLVTIEANASLQTYPINSPIAGSVLERHVNPGESVGSDTVLMKIADLNTVWAEFAVFARDLGRVRAGLAVRVNGSDNGQATQASIAYVAPAGDADSQSVVARAILDNGAGRWIPGQFAAAEVVISEVHASIAVLPASLQVIDGKTVVFVQTARGFQAREVKVGQRSRQAVEILEGLRAGERYAAINSYLIKADLLKGEAEEE